MIIFSACCHNYGSGVRHYEFTLRFCCCCCCLCVLFFNDCFCSFLVIFFSNLLSINWTCCFDRGNIQGADSSKIVFDVCACIFSFVLV